MKYQVVTHYCIGPNETREFASFEEAMTYAESLRDPAHTGSSRDWVPQVYSETFGKEMFEQGILGQVDVSHAGCVPSVASVMRRKEEKEP